MVTDRRLGRRGLLGLAVALGAGCGVEPLRLSGAGATLPSLYYRRLFEAFELAHPELRVEYRAVGSGGGIRQLMSRSIDFCATDLPLDDEDRALIGQPVLEVPTALLGLGLAFHLPGIDALRLSRNSLVGLLAGDVRALGRYAPSPRQPRLSRSPRLPVSLVVRSDGSGSTAMLAELCATIRPSFSSEVGRGRVVGWPVGVGVRGSGAVARRVAETPGALGYVEALQAARAGLALAALENRRGEMVAPSTASIEAATVGGLRSEREVFDVDAPGAYPLVSCSFVVLPRSQPELPSRSGRRPLALLDARRTRTGADDLPVVPCRPRWPNTHAACCVGSTTEISPLLPLD
jgi:phosphate transport system substrate-binding protein